MWRGRLWLAVRLSALLLLAGVIALFGFTVLRSRKPSRPTVLPRGDFTYAGVLATHEIERVMAQYHVPGMAALLINDQEVVWEGYFGLADREREISVDGETVFKLWSLAKPATALETMRLVEEGLLDLDAPLAEYVPGFSIQSRFAANTPITARHLLAHRAGLPRNGCSFRQPWQTGSDALQRLADALADCYIAYPTGTRFKYSNVGYDTLGYIIQDLRGQPFPRYMRDRLLRPIGMAQSAFHSTELPTDSVQAVGYEYFEREYYAYEQLDIGAIPSGNLYATPRDLAALVTFLLGAGEVGGEQIIAPDTLRAMYVDQYSRPADPQPMGLGWKLGAVLDGELLVWHDGGPTEGIGGLIAMLPDRKLGVVLLGNGVSFEGSVALPIAMALLEVMAETQDGTVPSEPASNMDIVVPAASLARYAGPYALFADTIDVLVDGDRLQGEIGGISFDLLPMAENRFRISHWLLQLGLADLLRLPMDLRALALTFQLGDTAAEDVLIVDFGGVNYEICPRYPALPAGSTWESLSGTYDLFVQRPAGQPAGDPIGAGEIVLQDGRLLMSGVVGPLVPIDERTLLILSGAFHGETIALEPATGQLTHQGLRFVPVP